MHYGERGFDGWGDVEKGEDEEVHMESSVIHFI